MQDGGTMEVDPLVSEDLYILASEKLQEDTPLNPGEEHFDFKVSSRGLEVNVRAATSFLSALKASLVLSNLGLLDHGDGFTCSNNDSSWNYIVDLEDELPRVVLQSLTRKPHSAPSQETITERLGEEADGDIDEVRNSRIDQDDLLQETLEKVFGHRAFKPQQRETISATIAGNNVLAIIGTGGGKSLTFMLPAVLAKRLTVVVSPTRSLIEDLFARSESSGLKSCIFLGGMDKELLTNQVAHFMEYKLVYATPEALDEHLLHAITENEVTVERVVFDEAHTIYTLGSTFRPKYRDVSEILAKLKVPKLLLSATIPARVQADLKNLFGGESWQIIAHTVHRENLTLKVKDRDNKYMDDLVTYLRQRQQESGIIYCVLPNDVAKIHAELLKRDINCVKYHGQLSEALK